MRPQALSVFIVTQHRGRESPAADHALSFTLQVRLGEHVKLVVAALHLERIMYVRQNIHLYEKQTWVVVNEHCERLRRKMFERVGCVDSRP